LAPWHATAVLPIIHTIVASFFAIILNRIPALGAVRALGRTAIVSTVIVAVAEVTILRTVFDTVTATLAKAHAIAQTFSVHPVVAAVVALLNVGLGVPVSTNGVIAVGTGIGIIAIAVVALLLSREDGSIPARRSFAVHTLVGVDVVPVIAIFAFVGHPVAT